MRRARPRVIVDVDEVVADFVGGVLRAVREVTGREHSPADVDEWSIRDALGLESRAWRRVCEDHISSQGFALRLDPIHGSVEGVAALREVADVVFVSAPWRSPTWVHDRERWVEEKFGDVPFVSTTHKYLVYADAIVDDKPDNVVAWYGEARCPRPRGMLWDMPHNRSETCLEMFPAHDPLLPVTRVKSWDEVVEAVAVLTGA